MAPSLPPDGGGPSAAPVEPRPLPLVGPAILSMVASATGFETTFIAEARIADNEQRFLHTRNDARLTGGLDIPEGAMVPWRDSICWQAVRADQWSSADVEHELPAAPAVALGVKSYAGAPIRGSDGEIVATLCAISRDSKPVSEDAHTTLVVLADLIAEQWRQERDHEAELRYLGAREQAATDHSVALAEAEHELKTLLAIIAGWVDILLDDDAIDGQPNLQHILGKIKNASQQATGQIQGLLRDAQDRDQLGGLELEPVNLSSITARTAEDAAAICTPRHRISCDIDPDLWAVADRQAITQTLWNLTENAVKYSPDGGTLCYRLHRGDDTFVSLSLSDEGIGLSEGEDLFSAFVRGSNVAGIPGSGIGLHLARRLMHAMHGTISAAPGEKRGTTFTLTLPRADVG